MRKAPGITLKQLAALTSSELIGNPDHLIVGVEDLESAESDRAAFLENPRYEGQMRHSKAGVIFMHPSVSVIEGRNFLLTKTPSLAFQRAIEAFIKPSDSGFTDIHPTAIIHPEASVAEGVTIGPYAVIDRKTVIGPHTVIGAHVVIGAEVTIGRECLLHPHATVRERCVLGNRVIIQPGAVIGSCGYGYFTDEKGKHHPLKQLGNVILEDDVEIGANTTIDRARFKSTTIGRGSKIDNLVQIAHQVAVGEDNLIVSQSGVAGSTTTGKNVVIGGQVGVVGHISLADHVILAARSAVSKSILKGGIYSGAPAIPIHEFNEQIVHIRNIKKLVTRIKDLEKSIVDSA